MVKMEGNAGEVDDFVAFWRAIPGVDQIRVKEDETNLMRPDAGHSSAEWKHPCHYLWRGPMYVKQNGDVYPCCQSYMLDGAPLGSLEHESLVQIWNSGEMRQMRELHASGRGGEVDICSRCCTTIPHPALVTGSTDPARPYGQAAAATGGTAGLPFETAPPLSPAAAPPVGLGQLIQRA